MCSLQYQDDTRLRSGLCRGSKGVKKKKSVGILVLSLDSLKTFVQHMAVNLVKPQTDITSISTVYGNTFGPNPAAA